MRQETVTRRSHPNSIQSSIANAVTQTAEAYTKYIDEGYSEKVKLSTTKLAIAAVRVRARSRMHDRNLR